MRRVRGLALLVPAVLVAACTNDESSDAADPPPQPDAPVQFTMRGGDVFAWTHTVAGRAECDDVTVTVNGAPIDAPVKLVGSEFEAVVPLKSGANEVVAGCDGDPGGFSEPLMLEGRLQARPTARVKVSVKGGTVTLDGRGSEATRPDGTEIAQYRWTPAPETTGPLTMANGKPLKEASGPRLRLRAPSRDGEYYVALEVADAEGRTDSSVTYFVVENGRARAVDLMHEHPAWIDSAVVYAPIPQLWGNGGPKSVARRMPYLKKLGVDALWLWPPTTERAAGEEYAITDYFKIDPSWGPTKAFKNMVDEAHRHGIHVLVDFVANHMSVESPYFKDAKEFGEASHYWDFFDRTANGRPTHYFDWTHLPNLNYDNPEVRRMIIESTAHWVHDLGVDGFRMDAVWGVKRRRPSFWPQWRRELKRINPDLLLLAEASAVDPYYFSHGFDVGYDWTKQPGQWAWGSAFEFPQEAGVLLKSAITNGGKGYAEDAIVMRFLNNNDTGARFVDQFSPDLTRVAATMQFTLPGIPSMFAGDEIGASYEPYSNLTPIVWKDRFGLRPFYDKLIDLKHTVPALNSNDVEVLTASPNSALAYIRPAVGSSGPILVILNYDTKARVEIAGTPALDEALGSSGTMRDLLTDKRVTFKKSADFVSLQMDGASYYVLVPGGS
jgi:cyclomaltodextrinase / maltogenic alpha-amylase / neopullulanase